MDKKEPDYSVGISIIADDEIFEMIAEYGIERVKAIDKLYPNSTRFFIEKILGDWKEESFAFKDRGVFRSWGEISVFQKLGCYFDFHQGKTVFKENSDLLVIHKEREAYRSNNRTISQILIDADNALHYPEIYPLWNEIVANRDRYPFSHIKFAEEHMNMVIKNLGHGSHLYVNIKISFDVDARISKMVDKYLNQEKP